MADEPKIPALTPFDRWMEKKREEDTPEAIREIYVGYAWMRWWALAVAAGKTVLQDKFKIEHAMEITRQLIDVNDGLHGDAEPEPEPKQP